MSSLRQSDRLRSSWGVELLLVATLAARCVPSYGLKEDDESEGGGSGIGGEAGVESRGGAGGSRGGVSGAPSAGDAGATIDVGGGGGEPGTGGTVDPGGSGGASSGSGGSTAGGANTGGAGGAGRGGVAGGGSGGGGGVTTGGTGGKATGGTSGSAGLAGSGGTGAVRACGSGGAPYTWANWCLPNHPGQGPYPQSYDTSTPGIVRDRVTGLVWEHPTNGVFAERTFAQAPSYCAALAAANYGGYTDWRVPSIIELVSITDYAVFDPAIDESAFPNTPSANFWTSAASVPPNGQAWVVASLYGVVAPESTALLRSVRCVR